MAAWAAGATIAAGVLRRQLAAPTIGSERAFVAVVGGTTAGVEPTWVLTKGAKTTDNTVTWQECTGQAGVNGDLTNTPNWTAAKNQAVGLGQVIKNVAASILLICTTAGTTGNGAEPTWNTAAGATTTDGTAVWTSIGVVANFTGTIWGAPHARVETMLSGTGWSMLAGDIGYVANNHTQTASAAVALAAPGTAAAPNYVLSVSPAAAPPTALAAGATIIETGVATLAFTGTASGGFAYWYGFTVTHSGNTNAAINIGLNNAWGLRFEAFAWQLTNAAGTQGITTGTPSFSANGSNAGTCEWVNCTLQVGQTGSQIKNASGRFIWRDTPAAIVGATLPAILIGDATANGGEVTCYGLDLSALGAGQTLVGVTAGTRKTYNFFDCKLGAGVVTVTGTPSWGGSEVHLVRSDSAATFYREEHYSYPGSAVQDTTNVRTGGATYPDGSTAISWKMVSNANPRFTFPLYSEWFTIWNEATGSPVTVSVPIAQNSAAAALNSNEVWLEAEALTTTAAPIGATQSSAAATLASIQGTAGSAVPTDSVSAWAGLTTPTKQKLSVTFTPQIKGPFRCRVALAKPSTTVWVDPLPQVA